MQDQLTCLRGYRERRCKYANGSFVEAVGIARLGDQALLQRAKADLVVTSLDQVDAAAVLDGILRIRPATEMSAHA